MPCRTPFKLDYLVLRQIGSRQESNRNGMAAFAPAVSSWMVFIHHWLLGFVGVKGVGKRK